MGNMMTHSCLHLAGSLVMWDEVSTFPVLLVPFGKMTYCY